MINLKIPNYLRGLSKKEDAQQILAQLLENAPITSEDIEAWLPNAITDVLSLIEVLETARDIKIDKQTEYLLENIDSNLIYRLPSNFSNTYYFGQRKIINILLIAFSMPGWRNDFENGDSFEIRETAYSNIVDYNYTVKHNLLSLSKEIPIDNISKSIFYVFLIYVINEHILPIIFGQSITQRYDYDWLLDFNELMVICKQNNLINISVLDIGKEPELEYIKETPEAINKELQRAKVGDYVHFSISDQHPNYREIATVLGRFGSNNMQIHGVITKLDTEQSSTTNIHVITPWLTFQFQQLGWTGENINEIFGPYGLVVSVDTVNQIFREDSTDFLANANIQNLKIDSEYDTWQISGPGFIKVPVVLKGIVGDWAVVTPIGKYAPDLPPVQCPKIAELLHRSNGRDNQLVNQIQPV